MLFKSVEFALRQRWLVLFCFTLICGLGIYCFTTMNVDAYPDISGVQVQIVTPFAGRAVEEVEQQVTIPLEKTMASVPRSEVIRSRTIFGLSLVQIIFEPDVEDYWARQVVYQKLSEAALPSDAQPSLGSLSTAYGEIYRYQIVGDKANAMELRMLNDWVIVPRLLRVKGVVEVANFGGLALQYNVQLDPDLMLQYGIRLQDVTAAVKANNSSGGGSFMERGSATLVIRGLGKLDNYKDLENIFVKNVNGTPVYIHDIGKAVIDHLPQTGIFGKNGKSDSVEGIVRMLRGENPSLVLAGIQDAVAELNETLAPKGIRLETFYDRTTLIKETLNTVFHNTALGIFLVVLSIFVILGSGRIALIAALTIPGSLLFALLLMKLTGIPISLLSVGAIDFGIIVDGALIVGESIVRHLALRKSKSVSESILDSSREVIRPMLFSMAIIILAYIPLLSLKYIEGLLFKPMAITLCFTLLGALLIAIYLVPVLSSFIFKAEAKEKEHKTFNFIAEYYELLLRKVLEHKKGVVITAGSLFAVVALFIVPRLGTEFLPYMDEGVFWVRANFPEGISLKENADYTSELRELIAGFQEVSFVTSQTGRNDSGTDPFPTNRTEMMIGLKPRSEWKDHHSKLSLEADLRKKLQIEFPTTRFNLTQPIIDSVTEDTNGTSADLAVEVIGPDLLKLRQLADDSVELLKTIPGSVNVGIEQEGQQPQLQINIDKGRLARYQLSVDTVNDVINTAIGGMPISQIYEGERRFNILAKFANPFVSTPASIEALPIFNEIGQAVPLGEVANVRVKDGQTLIARANAMRRVTVRLDIRNRAQGDFVNEAQRKFANELKLPPGYSVEWKGMFENLERAQRHFSLLIPLTIAIIFVLLYLNFGSVGRALLVLTSIPFALVGSALALWLRGMHVNVSVGVGFTSLFGVATMYGVLMLSYINRAREEEKLELTEAILRGCKLLLRPVLLTASVAILGLLPASLAMGIGSDVQRPIATVIVWGLFSSAVLTLFVLPAIIGLTERVQLKG